MHVMRSPKLLLATLAATVLLLTVPSPAFAADCSKTSVGYTALPDLATGTYKGEPGGLYPGGVNEPPAAYADAGRRAAAQIVPLDAAGVPSASGKVVLLSIGMSNTTQEFSTFVAMAKADPLRAASVVVVDGAQGGQDARVWAKADAATWTVVDDRLRSAGVTAAQVQAVWLKQAVARVQGDFATTTRELTDLLGTIVTNAAQRYPNLRQVFVSPRTYAGYATTQLNPEPYAYESGFAVRALAARSIAAPTARPWIGWGPYLWTDGTAGRADGFTWTCDDAAPDGTHPSTSGRRKVAELLQRFFDTSPFAAWYHGGAPGATISPGPVPSAARTRPPRAPAATPSPTDAALLEVDETPDMSLFAGVEDASDVWPWVLGGVALLVFGGATFLLTRRKV
jgi:hypothetical protein